MDVMRRQRLHKYTVCPMGVPTKLALSLVGDSAIQVASQCGVHCCICNSEIRVEYKGRFLQHWHPWGLARLAKHASGAQRSIKQIPCYAA